MIKDKKVVILSAKRTPIGKFLGAFASLTAPKLASFAIKSAIEESSIDNLDLDYAIIGNVIILCQGRNSTQSLNRCEALLLAAGIGE